MTIQAERPDRSARHPSGRPIPPPPKPITNPQSIDQDLLTPLGMERDIAFYTQGAEELRQPLTRALNAQNMWEIIDRKQLRHLVDMYGLTIRACTHSGLIETDANLTSLLSAIANTRWLGKLQIERLSDACEEIVLARWEYESRQRVPQRNVS